MGIQSFRDLRVWQAGMDLVEEVYRVTAAFPAQEMYALTNQMRRAAVSIPSNIAEGHARDHTREYLHHVSVARASLAELQTQMEIAGRLGYTMPEQVSRLLEQAEPLAKQLHALRNSLAKKA